jgi:hypothetical protein
MVHPQGGMIEADFRVEGATLHGRISLPPGINGYLILPDVTTEIAAGGTYEF